MAINGRIKVDMGEVFPKGLYVWADAEVVPARDFDKSTRANAVQAIDEKDTGLPLWQLDALDPDTEARGKHNAVTIKIVAQLCPSLPDSNGAGPVVPIELEGFSVLPYIEEMSNGRTRIAWSYRATGIKAPGKPAARPGNAGQAGKEQAA